VSDFWCKKILIGGKMNVTFDTTLGTLLDNPQAKGVLEKYAPGISTHPMVGMVKGMTLNNLVSMPQAAQMGVTREKVQKVIDEINKLP
jgi:hypothetical protein